MISFDADVQEVEVICSGKKVLTPGSLPLRQSKDHACTVQIDEAFEDGLHLSGDETSYGHPNPCPLKRRDHCNGTMSIVQESCNLGDPGD